MRIHPLLLALPLVAAVPARAQWFPTPPSDSSVPTLIASASAEVLVRPDRAVVYASLVGRAGETAMATAAATAARDRAFAALREIGIADDRVALWGAGMGADLPPGMMMRPGGDAPGAAARFGVRVLVDPIDRLDDVLAALSRAGVESVPLVRLERSDVSAARAEATTRAVAAARAQAEEMARAVGVRLGELYGLVTFGGFEEIGQDTRFFHSGFREGGATLVPEDVKVRVIVQGTWRIQP